MFPRNDFLLGMVCLMCLACQPKRPVEAPVPTAIAPSDTSTSKQDTSAIQPSKPVAAVKSPPVRILFAGTYHGDEVEKGIDELPWLGLYPHDAVEMVLRPTDVVAKRVVDEILDNRELGEMTGWEITTSDQDYPVMLIAGGDIAEGKVAVINPPATLYPGDSARFSFNSTEYLLYATGVSTYDSASEVHRVSDYRLWIQRTRNGESKSTLLAHHEAFDDAMVSVLWSGDLDRDGYLDLLINMTDHYNLSLPTLFLSKPAGDKVLVPVADRSSIGC